MAKISSLTDNTNQIVYPQTKANAVIMEDSTTVENAIAQRPKMVLSAEEPASTIADNTLYGVYGDVGQITTGEIADSAVTTAKIASSAVTEAKLGAGAVTTDKLGSSAVTTAKINSLAVTTAKINSLAVTTAKIANGAVTGATNSATSIGSAKLALNTVGTPNLRDGAVTTAKIASGAVTIEKTNIAQYLSGTTKSYTIATGSWSSLASSSPYTYSATVTATTTIGNDTLVHLLNDQPVLFSTYGFAVGAVSGQNVTIYSVGQPSSSVTLKISYKETV